VPSCIIPRLGVASCTRAIPSAMGEWPVVNGGAATAARSIHATSHRGQTWAAGEVGLPSFPQPRKYERNCVGDFALTSHFWSVPRNSSCVTSRSRHEARNATAIAALRLRANDITAPHRPVQIAQHADRRRRWKTTPGIQHRHALTTTPPHRHQPGPARVPAQAPGPYRSGTPPAAVPEPADQVAIPSASGGGAPAPGWRGGYEWNPGRVGGWAS
jgi:hypothetical protein